MNKLLIFSFVVILVILAVESQEDCGRFQCEADECCIRGRRCRPLLREGQICGIGSQESTLRCKCAAGLECTGRVIRRCAKPEATTPGTNSTSSG
ncbi:U33-theraphotoxin-Cg1c-like [Uloborus diversus]|uniref:U33-theraphotoxin-Cg1c-like n=1 Tax=Uloborus diversus TaxID=327109 RepID=UPI0024090854|nr:U33-theraphotoxin-Cg1c-like [Uloborus diversus]